MLSIAKDETELNEQLTHHVLHEFSRTEPHTCCYAHSLGQFKQRDHCCILRTCVEKRQLGNQNIRRDARARLCLNELLWGPYMPRVLLHKPVLLVGGTTLSKLIEITEKEVHFSSVTQDNVHRQNLGLAFNKVHVRRGMQHNHCGGVQL